MVLIKLFNSFRFLLLTSQPPALLMLECVGFLMTLFAETDCDLGSVSCLVFLFIFISLYVRLRVSFVAPYQNHWMTQLHHSKRCTCLWATEYIFNACSLYFYCEKSTFSLLNHSSLNYLPVLFHMKHLFNAWFWVVQWQKYIITISLALTWVLTTWYTHYLIYLPDSWTLNTKWLFFTTLCVYCS